MGKKCVGVCVCVGGVPASSCGMWKSGNGRHHIKDRVSDTETAYGDRWKLQLTYKPVESPCSMKLTEHEHHLYSKRKGEKRRKILHPIAMGQFEIHGV